MFYYKAKRKPRDSFYNIRNNIYNQRVDNNVTKQIRNSLTNRPLTYTTDIISDKMGLDKAYYNSGLTSPDKQKHGDGRTHMHGETLYIAGSSNREDWYDDFTKIPFWGDLQQSTAFKDAEKTFVDNPQIKTLVGHSLGSSIGLELQKTYPERNVNVRTYNGPILDVSPFDKVERYRNYGDVVSIVDNSAQTTYGNTNKFGFYDPYTSHDYANIAKNKFSEAQVPIYENRETILTG